MNDRIKTALIITEDLNTKSFLRKTLGNLYHLIETEKLENVLSIAENTKIDLVIIDNVIDPSLEIPFQLKKRKKLFTVPIILITSNLKKSFKEKAIKAGVFDFLYSPIREEELKLVLKKCENEQNVISKTSAVSSKIKQ
ncbi:MAG: response regulator [Parachlamydiales bacterium]|jgi:response regulator RpfG family c-di-GMP phosphodiesterase